MKLFANENKIRRFMTPLFFISLMASAQESITTARLSIPPKPFRSDHPLFSTVIVIDNRFDTAAPVNVLQGKRHLIRVNWATPLREETQAYIEAALFTASPARSGTLLIELRRYEANSDGMHFHANAWYKDNDGNFVPFTSMDTVFKRRWRHYLTGGAIDAFLKEIDQKRIDIHGPQSAALPLDTIQRNNVRNEWGNYPINQTENYPPGVYTSYKTFRNNQAEPFSLTLKKTDDGVYTVQFTDTLPDAKKKVINWLNWNRGRGIISYEGELYYLLDYSIGVPFIKKNNTFYFHLPATLPNMYYLNQIRDERFRNNISDLGPVTNGASLAVAAGGAILGSFATDALIKSLKKEGIKDPAMRDCYIDLDSGIIHSY